MSIRNFLRFCAHAQLLPVLESGEETLVGGQAVMEGVMMRAPHSYCVAVRKPSGELVTEQKSLPKISEKYPIFKYPVLRGLGTLGQAMALGFKALQFSMNAALDDGKQRPGETKEMPGWVMGLNAFVSIALFIVLYKFVPLYLATQIGTLVPAMHGRIAINLMDGVIRLVLFLAVLFLISRMKDIHRVFEYHGAEHKVVFNFESGKPVTVENAQQFVTWHPRCGTSFLIVVMLMSLLLYAFLPIDNFAAKLIVRIALLPLVVGLSYEIIRYAAKHRRSLMALITAPGLWLQRVTTQPPSDEQAAVAIRALEGAMSLEEAQGGELVIA